MKVNLTADSTDFMLARTANVESLGLQLQEYHHQRTGAVHFHLQANDPNNAFTVAFRTVPTDSTGVAHILEHTTLCGSQRFPVRDPFFMMMRRSLNTFMNAFTSADTTAYPFATRNRKDFENLLQVYLDAVFFPHLHELDFAQEGHRLEFKDSDDASSGLEFKGVVYNEMKGALSAPTTRLWFQLQAGLFPSTTYHFNSGGDPTDIPELSYEDLKAFHARHYHPSNAIFMTYGDFPVDQHQRHFEQWALRHFSDSTPPLEIRDEQRFVEPGRVEFSYPAAADELVDHTQIVMGWLLGYSADLQHLLECFFLNSALLQNSASPLLAALETSEIGSGPSELCGIDSSFREVVFTCGIDGSNPESADEFEKLVFDVLRDVADAGVSEGQVEAVLNRLELGQREMAIDYPYGLQLMSRMLPAAVHHGDPLALLDLDEPLAQLRTAAQQPGYLQALVRRLLIDNPHRVTAVMRPDTELAARIAGEEQARLKTIESGLDDNGRAAIVERARQLQIRQDAQDDPDILPQLTLDDIPADLTIPVGKQMAVDAVPATWFPAATNGLVHQQVVVDLPAWSEQELQLLPLFLSMAMETGSNGEDYLATQKRRGLIGVTLAYHSVRGQVYDPQEVKAYAVLAGKGLFRNQQALTEFLRDGFLTPRFDELARIRDLTSQYRTAVEMSISDEGHSLAMIAAQAGIAAGGYIVNLLDGPVAITRLKALDDSLEDPAALARFAEGLANMHAKLLDQPRRVLAIGEATAESAIRDSVQSCWSGQPPPGEGSRFAVPAVASRIQEAWLTNTQVNFCARVYPTVPATHPDAAALVVLGPFLREGFVHGAIREKGGAYGGGTNYNADAGSFRFYSYRDPRLDETLRDFDAAVAWVQDAHTQSELEEAILAVMRGIDTPRSPAGEAIQAFIHRLQGYTPEFRRDFRQRSLQVTLDALRHVAATYLVPDNASTAVIAHVDQQDACTALGLTCHRI